MEIFSVGTRMLPTNLVSSMRLTEYQIERYKFGKRRKREASSGINYRNLP